MTIDELIESGIDHARTCLVGHKDAELVPAFVVHFRDRAPAIVATPWRNDDEKTIAVESMRLALKLSRAHVVNYLFWSEAWCATEDPKNPIGLQPRDRMDRREVVIINAFDKKGGRMAVLEIMRGPDGVVTELVEDKPGKYDRLKGRLHNLLQDPS